jgi:hypothetical protein
LSLSGLLARPKSPGFFTLIHNRGRAKFKLELLLFVNSKASLMPFGYNVNSQTGVTNEKFSKWPFITNIKRLYYNQTVTNDLTKTGAFGYVRAKCQLAIG